MTTTSMPSSTKMSSAELKRSLDLVEIKPGKKFSLATLKALLPDTETILFFGKVYELNARQLANLLHQVKNTDLTSALFAEGAEHSNDLQDYVLEVWDDYHEDWMEWSADPVSAGEISFAPDVPHGEILPEVWKTLEVEVAKSIKDVAAKLEETVLARLPGKQGAMVFSHMMKLNAKRPVIGDFRASITHARQAENLLILDVSGSMSEGTIRRIIDDVVALSYQANAHMAVVSNSCTYWQPGTYAVDDVLAACEFGGTHYEELAPLFDRDWGVVITVADYDSSPAAKGALSACVGRIDQVLDISLVNQPTYLAQCVGQLAAQVEPLLIGSSGYILA